jgi:ABC-type amino acid transport substrate-binding protein
MNSSDGLVPAETKTNNRPIFRPEAVRRYAEAREQSVWFTSTPVYASGLAIVVDTRNKLANIEEGMAILALLPPEAQPALDKGKTILIQVNASSKPLKRETVAFEKDASYEETNYFKVDNILIA